MSKTWLITPAFCKDTLLSDCLAWIYRDGLLEDVEHVIIDNHYPVDRAANRASIRGLAQKYGCTYVDSGKDLGLHEGINNAARVVGIKTEDVVVGCDPDDRPSAGFVEALSSAIRSDPKIAVAAACFGVIDQRIKEGVFRGSKWIGLTAEEEKTAPLIHPFVEMWNVAAFNWRFISDIGGLKQPNGYYGGLESFLYSRWQHKGMKLVYLPSVRSDCAAVERGDPTRFDPEYQEWKHAHVGGFPGSFEQYLIMKNPTRPL